MYFKVNLSFDIITSAILKILSTLQVHIQYI